MLPKSSEPVPLVTVTEGDAAVRLVSARCTVCNNKWDRTEYVMTLSSADTGRVEIYPVKLIAQFGLNNRFCSCGDNSILYQFESVPGGLPLWWIDAINRRQARNAKNV